MSAMDEQETYSTFDLGLASYLMCHNWPVTLEDVSPTKVRFVFPDQARVQADEFIRGGLVSARLFSAAMTDLKKVVATRRSANQRRPA